ncbi:histone-lysine N-methyltransferase PRDM7-like [Pangasianodon hypophthalmus]|uniref:histone-lysine N-methyltransferase PRDM7-like n=1 Tax=Pangasianodon hypophthalmus TaxID=310915 RepID=UPI002308113E|nr:histone-lysine N-methyltransferase PRDM7-like [Pangasianodon hypophthalmus]
MGRKCESMRRVQDQTREPGTVSLEQYFLLHIHAALVIVMPCKIETINTWHCEDEQIDTDGGTESSVGHVSFMDKQNAGFKTRPLKEKPEVEDYLCGGTLSSLSSRTTKQFLKNPIKEEDSEDKDYLYSEDCKAFFINRCEIHGPALFILDTPVPLGVTDRARQTLPPRLGIWESVIPHVGLGVFNEGETVPVGAHFGPYQGELVDGEEAMNSGYSWVIFKNRQYKEYVDAKREVHANWMRYVKCACNDEEQNLVAFQYQGRILYCCC